MCILIISIKIDVLTVTPFIVDLILLNSTSDTTLKLLKLCRMLRIIRVAKIGRHNENIRIMLRTMVSSRGEMAFMATLIILSSVIFSSLCYLAEGSVDDSFKSIPDAIWWSCITQVNFFKIT